MTRRRVLLALVVTVLAVGCAAPWWEDVWLAAAYEEAEDSGFPLVAHVKSFGFLPGRSMVVRPVVCHYCYLSMANYYDGWSERQRRVLRESAHPTVLEVYDRARAGCMSGVEEIHQYCWERKQGREYSLGDGTVLDLSGWNWICPTCYPERQ